MTREELEKQIFKILKKSFYKDGDVYVFYNTKALKNRIKEIASLIEQKPNGKFARLNFPVQKYFERQFVEWLMKSEYFKGQFSEEYLTTIIDLPQFDTLDQLFDYWQNNIKDK